MDFRQVDTKHFLIETEDRVKENVGKIGDYEESSKLLTETGL